MELTTIIGGVAAVASAVSFAPQAIKIIRSRDTSSISLGMYVITVTGFVLWVIYGVLLSAIPVIASNSICLVLSAFILVMKLLPKEKKQQVGDALEPLAGRDAGAAD